MSFTPTVSRHHDDLARIMRPFQGKELTTAQIKDHVEEESGHLVAQWVHPSDHCSNHTCEGACECARSDRAIFEQIQRGLYRVLIREERRDLPAESVAAPDPAT